MPDGNDRDLRIERTPDSILVQVLAGQTVWAKLSKPQRALLLGHRSMVDESAKRSNMRYAISAAPLVAARRTLASLRSKGVIDDRDRLTWSGAYALLWGPNREGGEPDAC